MPDYYRTNRVGKAASFTMGALSTTALAAVMVGAGYIIDKTGLEPGALRNMFILSASMGIPGLILAAKNNPSVDVSRGGIRAMANGGRLEFISVTEPHHITNYYNKAARVLGSLSASATHIALAYNLA